MYRVDVYKGNDGDWYWRLVAPNGRIVCVAGEGYSKKSNAIRSVKRMKQLGQRLVWVTIDVRIVERTNAAPRPFAG